MRTLGITQPFLFGDGFLDSEMYDKSASTVALGESEDVDAVLGVELKVDKAAVTY